ncbi:2791_t:CDS:2, partial [Dentiscutata heterogama]
MGTPGYTPIPFPNIRHPPQSNSVFAFNEMQVLDNTIARLFGNFHDLVLRRQHPVVGRVYVLLCFNELINNTIKQEEILLHINFISISGNPDQSADFLDKTKTTKKEK